MGDYNMDDYYQRPRKKRYGPFSMLFMSIVSSVIGGVVVLYMLPFLLESGYVTIQLPTVPTNIPASSSSPQPAAIHSPVIQQTIQAKVETDTVKAVSQVEKSVVGIVNIQEMRDFWTRSTQAVERGTGSGVIFAKKDGKGLIVTNYHVIRGAVDVEVSLANGARVKGHVLGVDPLTDLAVLEIPGDQVESIAEFGTSSHLQVGEPAIAIGNPLGLHFSRTVTQGIISSLERSMPIDVNEDGQPDWQLDVIQTDAAINPGNSGGALINMTGKVIGINSLKISQAGIEGIGFAIPIDDARPIIEDLLQYGKVKRPYLGIVPRDLREIPSHHLQNTLKLPAQVTNGVVVMEVVRGKTELQTHDVIVALDDQSITDSAEMRKYLYTKKADGDKVKVSLYRNGQLTSSVITLYYE
ncbi:S1C family serine protease [Ammoniphilus sp. CFH 90114]|uniref:S1C family serine protease n=1 Tax=Ammoniphilus sp. CFH 90114 TaxID=2493665 RepID=UPI00100EB2C4|nr:S1C family serine protease [Ammoniphilus sp. CFH 90114]RXT08866.1 serine protease [Ammoniphilus sp. CFH 90114]